MRLTSPWTFILPITLVLACSGGGDETGGSPTSNPSTGDTPSTGGPTTGSPTTGGSTGATGTSTGEPTTGGTTGGTTGPASSSSTGEPATSTTVGTTVDTGSTGPVDSSTGEPDTTSGSSAGETGVVPLDGCVTDKDCALHNDCCDCYGEAADDPDGICKKLCEEPACDLIGIDQAVCRFGVCVTEKVDCDGTKVVCDSLPPECPKGQRPGVVNGCWSGACVPALSCDVVPDCGSCPAGTMCVVKQAQLPAQPTCEPIPAECGGKIDCECAGELVCVGIFTGCSDPGGNELDCSCPAC